MVTCFINACTSFCILFPVRVWSSTSHNKSQQLFLGSGGKWQSFPQQDKEMVTSHGWGTKAMWRLFVYMHMMVWVVKYEVNYLISFRRFTKDCLLVWLYRILHHNVEKKKIFTWPKKKIIVFFFRFLPTYPVFFLFSFSG